MTTNKDIWYQGSLLVTNITRKFDKNTWEEYDREEKRKVFRHFYPYDEGRSRELVAIFLNADDAARAVADHNIRGENNV
jgi:hypothetical protein